jgi:hypothetical protein
MGSTILWVLALIGIILFGGLLLILFGCMIHWGRTDKGLCNKFDVERAAPGYDTVPEAIN